LDSRLYRDINQLAVHTPWAHSFMKAFAVYGVGLFAMLVIAAWWYARRSAEPCRPVAASLWTAIAVVAAVGVNQVIGRAVHRGRPYATLHGVEVLVSRTHDFSFPSDHAVTAGAAAAGLWVIAHYGGRATRRIAVTGTVLALLVGFSRVYVGAHYPGDVVAGLLFGAAVTTLGWLLVNRPLTTLVESVSRRPGLRLLIATGRPANSAATS